MAGDGGRVPDVSEQWAAMPERAEIEALLGLAVCATCKQADNAYCSSAFHLLADRVRDARGDDEAAWRGEEHQWDQGSSGVGEAARSPQGEDHEGGHQNDERRH